MLNFDDKFSARGSNTFSPISFFMAPDEIEQKQWQNLRVLLEHCSTKIWPLPLSIGAKLEKRKHHQQPAGVSWINMQHWDLWDYEPSHCTGHLKIPIYREASSSIAMKCIPEGIPGLSNKIKNQCCTAVRNTSQNLTKGSINELHVSHWHLNSFCISSSYYRQSGYVNHEQ